MSRPVGSKNKVRRERKPREPGHHVRGLNPQTWGKLQRHATLEGLPFAQCLEQAIQEYIAARSPSRNGKAGDVPGELQALIRMPRPVTRKSRAS